MDRTGLKIFENNKNILLIISVNTNILLRRFRLKFLRIMCSTSCYKKGLNFENTLYILNRIIGNEIKKRAFAFFVDLKPAFDNVVRDLLWEYLRKKRINEHLVTKNRRDICIKRR
jgi:hypothetical protein